jgi:hypothetical protein
LSLLSAPAVGSGQDDLEEFYRRFSKVKDFHRKNTGINARQLIMELDDLVRSDGLQSFQGEEEEDALVIDRERFVPRKGLHRAYGCSSGLDLLRGGSIWETP